MFYDYFSEESVQRKDADLRKIYRTMLLNEKKKMKMSNCLPLFRSVTIA